MIFLPLTFFLSSALDSVIDSSPVIAGSVYSISVADENGEVVYQRGNRTRVIPASNEKIFSALFALHRMGPYFQPKTEFWNEPDRIFVNAPGNPLVTSKELKSIAASPGWDKSKPVYVKQAYAAGFPDSWEHDDLPNRYAAPVYSFTVDKGGFELWGEGGHIVKLPKEFGVKVQWVGGKSAGSFAYSPLKAVLDVRGQPPKAKTLMDTLSLPHPDYTAAKLVGAKYLDCTDIPERGPDAVLFGPPLIDIVRKCLPPSDNQLAEQLFMMAAAFDGVTDPGNPYPEAQKEMEEFLETEIHIPDGEVHPIDGSGLSRHNLLTTRSLVQALAWASRQSWADRFKMALAAPGVGTLENRLAGSSFRGKTGSLGGVAALSGYVVNRDGREMIVSIVFNNTTISSAKVRDLADSIVKTVETEGSSGTNSAYHSSNAD